MITIRKSANRGLSQTDWLTSFHSFSFGDYIDPANKGFGTIRVINEDIIAPGGGFDTHPHWDMEILTYIIEGTLKHRDSMGNQHLINAGDVQRISAGTGIEHSEVNPSNTDPVRLVQIWIFPEVKGIVPSYEYKHFPNNTEQLQLLASKSGKNDSITIKQNLDLYLLRLQENEDFTFNLSDDKAWIQVLSGSLEINENKLEPGDAIAVEELHQLQFKAQSKVELLIFDVHKKKSLSSLFHKQALEAESLTL